MSYEPLNTDAKKYVYYLHKIFVSLDLFSVQQENGYGIVYIKFLGESVLGLKVRSKSAPEKLRDYSWILYY